MSRIGLDLDGVLYDFGAAFRRFLVYKSNRFLSDFPEPTRWEFYLDWGMSLEEFKAQFAKGVNQGHIFLTGAPFLGTVEQVVRLADAGHSIHIITDRMIGRPGIAAQSTLCWLSDWNIPYDSITFSADKTLVPTDFMIDDKPDNYRALAKTDCIPVLQDRPWNQGCDCERRADSMKHFVDFVLEGTDL